MHISELPCPQCGNRPRVVVVCRQDCQMHDVDPAGHTHLWCSACGDEGVVFGDEDLPDAPAGLDRLAAPAPAEKIGRNEPCPCGSTRKFKKCHGA